MKQRVKHLKGSKNFPYPLYIEYKHHLNIFIYNYILNYLLRVLDQRALISAF